MAIYLSLERNAALFMLRLAQAAYRKAYNRRIDSDFVPREGKSHAEDARMAQAFSVVTAIEDACHIDHDPNFGGEWDEGEGDDSS